MKAGGPVVAVADAGSTWGAWVAAALTTAAVLAVCSPEVDRAKALTKSITKRGGVARPHRISMVSESDIDECFADVIEQGGQMRGLVVAHEPLQARTIEHLDDGAWDAVEERLEATFLWLKYAAHRLDQGGGGRIVIVTGREFLGREGYVEQSAVSAGLIALARTAALEFARSAVAVNVLSVGLGMRPEDRQPDKWSRVTPARRVDAEAFSRILAFLAIDVPTFVTGQLIHVSGGQELLPALVLEPPTEPRGE